MKILVIAGSLRKKNTYAAVKKVQAYHQLHSDVEYEYIFLKDFDLKPCRGCGVCLSHGESRCPQKDDRDLLIQKIESADGVILASPNYVMNVSWLMKNYIDRFAYTMHRPKFFNQYFMVLITSGSFMGTKQASKSLGSMASGGKIVSTLKVLGSPGMNEKKLRRQDKTIQKQAAVFYRRLSAKTNHRPPFGFLIWFSVFKATSNENRESMPADYDFYKNKSYFTDVKLNALQKAVIVVFTAMFTALVRRGLV